MDPSGKRITIGRKPGNTITLNNPDISGTHAVLRELQPGSGLWEIQDMGSVNGTFVDGVRIYRKEVTKRNRIRLGQTEITWDTLLDIRPPVIRHEEPEVPLRAAPPQPAPRDEALREIAWNLKKTSDEYREKKNRMAEIQAQEALSSKIQQMGMPIGMISSAGLVAYLPQGYNILGGILGSTITLGFYLVMFSKSKKLSTERKQYLNLEDWYKINYVCPHCHTFIQQPFELLEKTKSCRACKKPLIP